MGANLKIIESKSVESVVNSDRNGAIAAANRGQLSEWIRQKADDTIRAPAMRVSEVEKYYNSVEILTPKNGDPLEMRNRALRDPTVTASVSAIASNAGRNGFEIAPLYSSDDPPKGALDQLEEVEVTFKAKLNARRSMRGLRQLKNTDIGFMGGHAWEIIRTVGGDWAGVEPAMWHRIRICAIEIPAEVDEIYRHPKSGKLHNIRRIRTFKKYVQYPDDTGDMGTLSNLFFTGDSGKRYIYYKEVGCPLHLNRYNGKWSKKPWPAGEEASELLQFGNYSATNPYGSPNWLPADVNITNMLNLRNLFATFFSEGMIDRKAIFHRGEIKDRTTEAIAAMGSDLRGVEKAFGWTFLQVANDDRISSFADGKSAVGLPVHVVDLSSKLDVSALAQCVQMDSGIIQSQYRVNPIILGMSQDTTKAVGDAAMEQFEDQVIFPIESNFDGTINRCLMPLNGWSYHTFRTIKSKRGKHQRYSDLEPYIDAGIPVWNAMLKAFAERTGSEYRPVPDAWADSLPIALVMQRIARGIALDLPISEVEGAGADEDKDVIQESYEKMDKKVHNASGFCNGVAQAVAERLIAEGE